MRRQRIAVAGRQIQFVALSLEVDVRPKVDGCPGALRDQEQNNGNRAAATSSHQYHVERSD